jgi:serine/threonine protein kinase
VSGWVGVLFLADLEVGLNSLRVDTLDRYRLVEQIGRGGMASVVKAYDPTEDRYVALKVLYSDLAQDEQFSRRFRREAKVVMSLKHPNIVPIEDFGEDNGYAYFVMPLLDVGSLADRLREGPLSPEEGAKVMDQMASGLQYAHDQGVVHRDVKPANIMIDDDGVAMISDFGLARIQDASISLTGSALLGTPAYMSPEQARGDPADARSDQYSLGVILYQLSTGTLPFDAETPMAIVLKQIREPLPLARDRSPNIPESVERVILKATSKDPDHRFESVEAMNQAFQAALAHSLDPTIHPAPDIELHADADTALMDTATVAQEPDKKRRRRLAALLALLLLFLLGCPAASILLGNGQNLPFGLAASAPSGLDESQITELAGTIDSMSTVLAATQDETLEPEQITTLVLQTLEADPTIQSRIETQVPTATGSALPRTQTSTPSFLLTPVSTGPAPASSGTAPVVLTQPPFTTSTTIPSTASPVPSSVPTDAPTPTPTMTFTPTPSLTYTPTASMTIPPSPTIDVCTQLDLGSFSTAGESSLRIRVYNNSSTVIRIDALHLDWDSELDELKTVDLGPEEIWKVHDGNPPTDIPAEGAWKSGADRTISAFSSENLTFRFDEEIEGGGTSLSITFDNGCQISN